MLGVSAASRSFQRTALAFGLCLLAFSFAMEAKLAWYGPQAGTGSDISAAKALPADVPALIQHGAPAANPFGPLFPCALLFVLATGCSRTSVQLKREAAHSRFHVHVAAYFSPHCFVRPPPTS